MKKIILLLSAVIGICLLTFLTFNLLNKKGVSDSELIDFAISDTSSVDQIEITDAFSKNIKLIKKNGLWTAENGDCISRENINFILDAAKNVEFKGYLPKNSIKKFTELMSTQNTKVSYFVNGEWLKTWYIGPASQDHYGQIMLLESSSDGKSSNPVMMKIKGINGIIEPRFFADPRKWMCSNIFSLQVNEIQKVDVKFYDVKDRSFSIARQNQNFIVKQGNSKLEYIDTSNIYRYLQAYNKIHFSNPNYDMSDKQCDSIKKSKAFGSLSLTETNGKKTFLKFFRISAVEQQRNEFGEMVNMDMNYFWCLLPNKQLVKCQYFVFNPLLLGHVYFPAMKINTLKITQSDTTA